MHEFLQEKKYFGKKQKKGGAFSQGCREEERSKREVWVPRAEEAAMGSPSAPRKVLCSVQAASEAIPLLQV